MGITLKGVTWNHSRGYVSVVATAQRFGETHPGVEIIWEKRSLQQFADAHIEQLADKYDLLVIDHPWAGFAADKNVLVPLERHLSAEYLQDQADNSVGLSHPSYRFGGFQSALAIDAATPVASYREDLLERHGHRLPDTWEDLISLADAGKVIFPGIPIDSLMNFYMLCSTQGEDPFLNEDTVISREMGLKALEQLRELASKCTREIFDWNPIQVYEAMSSRDDFAYCPFAYGYSNYSRSGYARKLIRFTDMVSLGTHGRLKSTLGGTGLAISAKCHHLDIALEYAAFTASPGCQRSIYVENGGQPGHRAAWLDEEVNRRTNGYFRATLPALDRAYLRPRYSGYLHFQDNAGDYVRDYMMNGGDGTAVLERMDRLYRESRSGDRR
ncbi:ABC transporter substrate-binding protein [Gordoniibacillus kamchatkensis]|uniref:ABC transporter substrate-binding protein n=1 Tax=Gordoniibacillus kamchatkensis TaxID=1590651 RepID=A0ABR5ALT0_9BACL|nr:extracellular solute-binding protein [Paenibacillus sp. VKM B-2647]KIL41485.1 ABC transporter substrate-binding protein [Paenibacillus sp. VKM B-2647]